MTARNCHCCDTLFNLAKIDPFTGQYIWRRLLKTPTGGSAQVAQIEPLHGSNDLIVCVNHTASPVVTSELMRVRGASGRVVWRTYVPVVATFGSSAKTFGVTSSGQIVTASLPLVSGQRRSLDGIDPASGATLWTVTYTSGEQIASVASGASSVYVGYLTSLGSPLNTRRKINPATGATIWGAGLWSGISTDDSQDIITCEDSSGDVLTVHRLSGSPRLAKKMSGATGALLGTASWYGTRARSGVGGLSSASFDQPPYAVATGGTSLTAIFGLSSTNNSTLVLKLRDTCSGSNGSGGAYYYYCGATMTSTVTAAQWNIFCVTSTGSFIWGRKWGVISSDGPAACVIGDDGYLYAGGRNGSI
ncbi:PQQ-binding-like beta-propeller repeat protein [Schlesneria sp. DSM 10557]|uniref:outer membrane protein assembly factor BamB family protein n=1 Tax=Schlesneria sp. DSM 10557 TaxID=3044399 RepID=UPI00359FD672